MLLPGQSARLEASVLVCDDLWGRRASRGRVSIPAALRSVHRSRARIDGYDVCSGTVGAYPGR